MTLSELQAESARANDAHGVIAFLVGVLAEVVKASTAAEARTLAEMGLQSIGEWHAGLWTTGPHDDAANWRKP